MLRGPVFDGDTSRSDLVNKVRVDSTDHSPKIAVLEEANEKASPYHPTQSC